MIGLECHFGRLANPLHCIKPHLTISLNHRSEVREYQLRKTLLKFPLHVVVVDCTNSSLTTCGWRPAACYSSVSDHSCVSFHWDSQNTNRQRYLELIKKVTSRIKTQSCQNQQKWLNFRKYHLPTVLLLSVPFTSCIYANAKFMASVLFHLFYLANLAGLNVNMYVSF